MEAHDLESLARVVVPQMREQLARADGGLPGDAERIAAFDTFDALVRARVSDLKNQLADARQRAHHLSIVAGAELPRTVRLELDRLRREEVV